MRIWVLAMAMLSLFGSISCFWLPYVVWDPSRRALMEPASAHWIRVRHPEIPISFEIPENTYRDLVGHVLGHPAFNRIGELPSGYRFGIRGVVFGDGVLHAVDCSFFWVTRRNIGVDTELLQKLLDRADEPQIATEFYTRAFLEHHKISNVRFRDLGLALIDGRRGRRLHAEQLVSYEMREGRVELCSRCAPGTFEVTRDPVSGVLISTCEMCPIGDYEFYVIPVSRRAALVVFASFNAATREEREGVFPRIAESVRIQHERSPGMER